MRIVRAAVHRLRAAERSDLHTLLLTLMAASAVVVAVTVVRAAPGTPGGASSDTLGFAGTLRDADGDPLAGPLELEFTFKHGANEVCQSTVANVSPAPDTGAFSVQIPIDACPAVLFDGSDVLVDVSVGDTVVVEDQPVSPVPYAKYADRVGSPDCPVGYERGEDIGAGRILCTKGNDEVVKVGQGASAFWIDRYEGSIWENPDGTGTQYGLGGDADYPAYPTSFPYNGQIANNTNVLYAVSKANVAPSHTLTWFQASLACRASGKRLPTGDEWLSAATGTPDLGANPGTNGNCATVGSARNTGTANATINCASIWGAEDMT